MCIIVTGAILINTQVLSMFEANGASSTFEIPYIKKVYHTRFDDIGYCGVIAVL